MNPNSLNPDKRILKEEKSSMEEEKIKHRIPLGLYSLDLECLKEIMEVYGIKDFSEGIRFAIRNFARMSIFGKSYAQHFSKMMETLLTRESSAHSEYWRALTEKQRAEAELIRGGVSKLIEAKAEMISALTGSGVLIELIKSLTQKNPEMAAQLILALMSSGIELREIETIIQMAPGILVKMSGLHLNKSDQRQNSSQPAHTENFQVSHLEVNR